MEISFDRDLTETLASFNTPYFANANNAETESCNSRTHSASRTVLNHDRAYVKPMMGNTKGSFAVEAEYDHVTGGSVKGTFKIEWGGNENRSERSRDRPETDNKSGEVNSTDRN